MLFPGIPCSVLLLQLVKLVFQVFLVTVIDKNKILTICKNLWGSSQETLLGFFGTDCELTWIIGWKGPLRGFRLPVSLSYCPLTREDYSPSYFDRSTCSRADCKENSESVQEHTRIAGFRQAKGFRSQLYRMSLVVYIPNLGFIAWYWCVGDPNVLHSIKWSLLFRSVLFILSMGVSFSYILTLLLDLLVF